MSIFPFAGAGKSAPPIEQQLMAAALAPENVTGLDRFLAKAAPARNRDERRSLFGELVTASATARIPGGGNEGALRRERAKRNITTILAELLDGRSHRAVA